jgi:hypothetical protein
MRNRETLLIGKVHSSQKLFRLILKFRETLYPHQKGGSNKNEGPGSKHFFNDRTHVQLRVMEMKIANTPPKLRPLQKSEWDRNSVANSVQTMP